MYGGTYAGVFGVIVSIFAIVAAISLDSHVCEEKAMSIQSKWPNPNSFYVPRYVFVVCLSKPI